MCVCVCVLEREYACVCDAVSTESHNGSCIAITIGEAGIGECA